MSDPLLSVEDLRTHFHTSAGTVRAVDGVSFAVHRGETVCLVGESGSGKTIACESLTKLFSSPPGEIVDGRIEFDATDLTARSPAQLAEIRGGRIAHVFQNPQGALDPVYSIGAQLRESIRLHRDVSKAGARERAVELLDKVGIPNATTRIAEYPHEFSGGMKQRIVIAMALAAEPDLLVADEPTTALDVTTQAGILDLLNDLQAEHDMAVLFVTHDLGVVAEMADRVVVLYAGKVMERGNVQEVFESPAHPYTRALFRCLPGRGERRETIEGDLPSPTETTAGCQFHSRCPHAITECREGNHPPLRQTETESHTAACIFYEEGRDSSAIRTDDERAGDRSEPTQTDNGRNSNDAQGNGDV